MMPPQAVVFDLDDTLYPERAYVLSGFRAVARWAEARWAIPATQGYEELHTLFAQGVRGDTFNRWLQQHGLDPAPRIPQLVTAYREHEPELAPFAGIPALLARLQLTRPVGLVSDGYLAVQRRKFAALGLAHHFGAVVFSDSWGRAAWKPSPVPFRAVLDQLGAHPEGAVYVGDNPKKDFLGARRLGMATIRLRLLDGEHYTLEPTGDEYAPDRTVGSVADLAALLNHERLT